MKEVVARWKEAGGAGIPWDRIPVELYVAAAVISVVVVLAALLVALVAWRRACRSPGWRAAKLRLQAGLDPSPARRAIARLRAGLDAAVQETNRTVEAVEGEGWAVAELPALSRRFAQVALPLQTELAVLAREPEDTVAAISLGEAEARVQHALDIGDSIRRAAMASLRRAADHDLGALRVDVDLEERGLTAALDELAARQTAPLLASPPRPPHAGPRHR